MTLLRKPIIEEILKIKEKLKKQRKLKKNPTPRISDTSGKKEGFQTLQGGRKNKTSPGPPTLAKINTQMICQLYLNPKDEVVIPEYSFLMYRIYSKIVGAKIKFAKEINFKVSIDELLKKVNKKTKIIFIANPNNPTGTYLTKNEVLQLRKRLDKNILLVIDDAYAEYMKNSDYSSGLDLFKNKNNVFVLRTFSKMFGLASLRVVLFQRIV